MRLSRYRLFVSVKACENPIGSLFRKLGPNTEDGINRRGRATLMYLGERWRRPDPRALLGP